MSYSQILKGIGKPKTLSNFNSNYRIVTGSFNQNSDQFGIVKNSQCLSCCVVSICAAELKAPSTWKQDDIDNIVIAGTGLHCCSLDALGVQTNRRGYHLLFDEILKPVQYENFNFDLQSKDGDWYERFIEEVPAHDSAAVVKCKFHLENFMNSSYKYAIIVVNQISIALIKESRLYWLFDSHSRDSVGNLIENGLASGTCYTDVNTLSSYVVNTTSF